MTRHCRVNRERQRGSAMLVTLIVTAALIAGGGVLVSLQLNSNRSADLTRGGVTALYCAEAGLAAARPVIAANYNQWASTLATGVTMSTFDSVAEPGWLSAGIGSHDLDLDQDGIDNRVDFKVHIMDNDDEMLPLINDRTIDNDMQVIIVVQCLAFPETPKQVVELVLFNGGMGCDPWQQGGCGGDGNDAQSP